jgi:hypothetical protein
VVVRLDARRQHDAQQAEKAIAAQWKAEGRHVVDQRARLVEAVYQGTQATKQEVLEGKDTEEPIRPGIEEKLPFLPLDGWPTYPYVHLADVFYKVSPAR